MKLKEGALLKPAVSNDGVFGGMQNESFRGLYGRPLSSSIAVLPSSGCFYNAPVVGILLARRRIMQLDQPARQQTSCESRRVYGSSNATFFRQVVGYVYVCEECCHAAASHHRTRYRCTCKPVALFLRGGVVSSASTLTAVRREEFFLQRGETQWLKLGAGLEMSTVT